MKNMIKKLLNEATKPKRYGCVMLYLDIDPDSWETITNLINKDDLYTEDGKNGFKYGIELDPHITLLYGLHSDIDIKEIEDRINLIEVPEIKVNGISTFDNENYSVLKFDVESKELNKYNKLFKELPYTSDYPNYHPHITIAYLQPNTGSKYAKIFNDEEVTLPKYKIKHVVYSLANGDKKTFNIN